jgi:hypothetical protein
LSQVPSWFPIWVVWIILPWLALHMYYDIAISRYLKAQRKPGDPPPQKSFALFRYTEIMKENTRRFENGDPLARVITYYDWAIAGGFVLLVAYRVLLR